jgi:hypothetical protein
VRVEHQVKIEDFTKWLERPGRTLREITQRQKIRAILCEIDNSGDLELSVPGRDDTPITISLRNALRLAPEEKV